MAKQSKYISYGADAKAANAKIAAKRLGGPADRRRRTLKNAFVQIDAEFWADHDEELTERFNKWVAQ